MIYAWVVSPVFWLTFFDKVNIQSFIWFIWHNSLNVFFPYRICCYWQFIFIYLPCLNKFLGFFCGSRAEGHGRHINPLYISDKFRGHLHHKSSAWLQRCLKTFCFIIAEKSIPRKNRTELGYADIVTSICILWLLTEDNSFWEFNFHILPWKFKQKIGSYLNFIILHFSVNYWFWQKILFSLPGYGHCIL